MVCNHCLGSINKGITHSCTSDTRRKNLEGLVRDSSPRSRHKLLGTGISDILEEQGVSRRGGTAHLHTGGSKPIYVTVGTPMVKSKPPPYFTADKIKRLQVILGESDKKNPQNCQLS